MSKDSNTLVMLHLDGNTSDECGHRFEATDINYAGAHSSLGAVSKWNDSIVVCKNPGFKLGGADFTIDFWVYATGSSQYGNLYSISYGSGWDCNNCISDVMQVEGAHGLYEVRTNWQHTSYGPTFTLTEKTFHHVAVVYEHSKSLTTVYVDGKKVQTLKRSCPEYNVTSVALFKNNVGIENNHTDAGTIIDEFRISSCARWTSDFAAPSKPPTPTPTPTPTPGKDPGTTPTPTPSATLERKKVHEKIGIKEWNALMGAVTDLATSKKITLKYTVPSAVNCIKDGRKWVKVKDPVKSNHVKNVLGAINQLESSFSNNCCQANCCQNHTCQSCQSQCRNCTECRDCTQCRNCSQCYDCTQCRECSQCRGSSECGNCRECAAQPNCRQCSQCSAAPECRECSQCGSKSNCAERECRVQSQCTQCSQCKPKDCNCSHGSGCRPHNCAKKNCNCNCAPPPKPANCDCKHDCNCRRHDCGCRGN